eukprot:CAMPEP_0194147024 /NCGR_PEP_ID=MMETSP0152-20130528/22474_1 /TAXON_ID=1049557 /ORGANISM="Thalassiothrix antarctica, Strain L6-D1" /LENGTH=290 /DNA_ID=CAMNT_0038847695 /DNA_START=309 /DNA_END=1181 /DNA_ORIENTATION=-
MIDYVPRGGGWLGGLLSGWKAEDYYRQTLEDQIQNLERQVRAAQEEATQLRKLLKLSSQANRQQASSASLRQELSVLQKQIKQLEIFQSESEKLLKDEEKRIKELTKKLEDSNTDLIEIQKQHRLEMEKLEKELLERSKEQVEALTRLMEERVQEATKRAKAEAMIEMDSKIKDAISKTEAIAESRLEEERKKAVLAVENERIKMRKLVKALADREKRNVTAAAAATVKVSNSSSKRESSSSKRSSNIKKKQKAADAANVPKQRKVVKTKSSTKPNKNISINTPTIRKST